MEVEFFYLYITAMFLHLGKINGSSLLNRFELLFEEQESRNLETRSSYSLETKYDFIIVGAGTAGCVLANRLSENPKWSILLIEAGDDEELYMDVPLVTEHLQSSNDINWKYRARPNKRYCRGFSGKQCPIPRGKVVGGTSVLDYALYSRGHKEDYDKWEKMGNKGWSYDNVLPYFQKIEDFHIPNLYNSSYHNMGGPLPIGYPPYRTKLATALMAASQDLDWKIVDYNANDMNGISYAQTTIRDGYKWSSNTAYLQTIKNRNNVTIKKKLRVLKVNVEDKNGEKRAVGVNVEWEGSFLWSNTLSATKEVIVTAGTIGSPKLLMLSGIGPKNHLKDMNISLVQNLKVGYNLMDHVSFGGLIFTHNDTTSLKPEDNFDEQEISQFSEDQQTPLTLPAGLEVCSFHKVNRSKNNKEKRPDVGLFYMDSGTVTHRTMHTYRSISKSIYEVYSPIRKLNSFMVLPTLLNPLSRGRIMLKDDQDETYPAIYLNYFEKQKDLETLVESIQLVLQITRQYDMLNIGTGLYQEPLKQCEQEAFATDDYWRCLVKYLTFSMHSLSGTCKMGPAKDKQAVVNPRLQVHGIKNLRVVDASIIPEITSAPISATVYMIAEKAADLIKEDYKD